MKLSSLRYYITVAKCGSFTKASDRLFISQPTLSRTIQELEEELGTQLFIRERRSLKLTEDGIRLLKEASEIVEHSDSLAEMFKSSEVRGRKAIQVIKVAYQRYFDIQWVYPQITAFMKEYPNCEILLEQADVQDLKKGINDGSYDAVFGLTPIFNRMKDLIIMPVEKNCLQLLVPETHRLAKRRSVSINELEGEDFILLNRKYSPVVVDHVISQCIKHGFSPNASHYVDNMEEALDLVGLGKGISFAHSGMHLEGMEKRYHVAFLDIEDNGADLDFALVYRKGRKSRNLIMLLERIGKDE
ncbi:MAG TPA: LysR family transcriptional regulator [Candidatus Pelethocola excrementipullorum]|nr:LysR family transcriptional regulator [Candidatus Pelethocola excrementipullorum]